MKLRATFLALGLSSAGYVAYADCTAVITPSGATTFCAGDSVRLSAPSGSGLSYEWKKGTTSVGTGATYIAKDAGDYTVTVNDGSCTQTSAAVTVVVNPLPGTSINPAGPLVLCPGQSRELRVSLPFLPIGSPITFSYAWKNGNTAVGGNSYAHTVNAAGSYTVLVRNEYTGCTKLSDPYVVTVNPLPTAVITPSWSTEICEGGEVTLDAGNVSGYDYQWKRNGAAAGVQSAITVSDPGNYKVVITDGAGCKDSSAVTTVNVHRKPEVSLAQGDTAVCTGAQVVLPAVTPDTGLVYTWYQASVAIPAAEDSTYTATETGSYHVVISRKDVYQCADTSAAAVLTVHDLPQPSIDQEPGRVWTNGGFASYTWYRNDIPVSGAADSALSTEDPGLYKVFVTDGNGCGNFSDTLRISEQEPSAIGTKHADQQVTFYPNPVQDVLHVRSGTEVAVYITNPEGRLVMSHQGNGNVSLGHLSAGIYLIRVTDIHGGLLHYGKLVKQ